MLLRRKRALVYSLYLDDSGRDRNIQIVGSVIIPSDKFEHIERQSGWIIQSILNHYPEVLADPKFEFHATDMWNRNPPWDVVSKSDIADIFRLAVHSLKY